MGATVCQAVLDDPELELVAAVDPLHAGIDLRQLGVDGAGHADRRAAPTRSPTPAPRSRSTSPWSTPPARTSTWCADHGVHAVVGTTGFERRRRRAASARASRRPSANAVIAPNFAIGAVLMMRFAELAAPYFETAEVIELHHDQKVDAPSGTAMLTVERMAAASAEWAPDPTTKTVVEGARGGVGAGGIPSTRCGCAGSSPTRRCCSAPPASRSRSATTPTTARRSCPACCSRCKAVRDEARVSRSASTRCSGSEPSGAARAAGRVAPAGARAARTSASPASGSAKTTVDDVAAASGVSRATIYRLFPGGQGRAAPRDRRLGDGPVLRCASAPSSVDAADFASSSSGRCRWPAGSCSSTRCSRRCSRPSPTG